MEWAAQSGSRDVRCSQEKVESVTGAQFTQSDSGDSNPICFGRRGCSLSGLAVIDPSSARDRTMTLFQFPHSFFPRWLRPVQSCGAFFIGPLTVLWPPPRKKKGHCFGQQQNFAWKQYCMFTESLMLPGQKTSYCGTTDRSSINRFFKSRI